MKHQTKVAVGKKTDEYATPEYILNFARMCFGVGQFDLDPFTMEHNPTNALMYFTKEDDGLVQDWYKARNIWINPPFSRMADVVPKVIHEAERGVNNPSIIMLTKGDFRTKWAGHLMEHSQGFVVINQSVKFIQGEKMASGAIYSVILWCFNVKSTNLKYACNACEKFHFYQNILKKTII